MTDAFGHWLAGFVDGAKPGEIDSPTLEITRS